MHKHWYVVIVMSLTMIAFGGCATSEEWSTWKQHPTHFSSGDHLAFSVRNREGAAPKVSRQDVALARDEGWWGKPVTIGQEQIIER